MSAALASALLAAAAGARAQTAIPDAPLSGTARGTTIAAGRADGAGAPARAWVADTAPTLSLAGAVERASRAAAGVQIAGARVAASDAQTREARAALLPSLRATAGVQNLSRNSAAFGFEFPASPGGPTIPDLIGPYSLYDARVYVQQSVFDYAAWKRLSASGARAEAARTERDAAADAAATRVAMAYLDAARAAALHEARRSEAELAGDLLTLSRRQLDAGVATAIDVTRARARQVSAESRLHEAERRREQAQIELADALGLDAATRFVLSDTLSAELGASAAPTAVDSAIALALRRRPDLQAERARRESTRLTRDAIHAERLPRLEVVGSYGYNGVAPDDVLGTREIGVQVAVPITDGLGRHAREAEMDARLDAAAIEEAAIRRRIGADVRTAALDLEIAHDAMTAAHEQAELAREAMTQARRRFETGIAGNIELIDAQAALNRAREAEIEARYRAAAARIGLAGATGVATTIH